MLMLIGGTDPETGVFVAMTMGWDDGRRAIHYDPTKPPISDIQSHPDNLGGHLYQVSADRTYVTLMQGCWHSKLGAPEECQLTPEQIQWIRGLESNERQAGESATPSAAV